MRIESALAVRRVKTRGGFNGDIWLGFERLTCVPIQTKMVNEKMLSKEEKIWLKVTLPSVYIYWSMCISGSCTDILKYSIQDHNNYCRQMLEPYLRDDKIALKWLKREAERGIGISAPGPGGFSIEWD
jgi:Xaa-Pro aminopeptidase